MKTRDIRTLIVGVDLSAYSKLVVREAKQLSAQLRLPLVYVFAYEDVDLYQEQSVNFDRAKIAKFYEEKIRSKYRVEKRQKVIIRFGRAEKEILAVAKKEKSPLIVVGHTSGHYVARFFLGSVAEELAATTSFPLWIHRGEKVLLPKKILVPSDLSSLSHKAINEIEKFRVGFKADVEIYHVLTEPFPSLDYEAWLAVETAIKNADDKKMKSFKKRHPSLKLVRSRGIVAQSIRNRSKKFDLVAVSPRPQSKSLFGRLTGKIVRSGNVPVLVLP